MHSQTEFQSHHVQLSDKQPDEEPMGAARGGRSHWLPAVIGWEGYAAAAYARVRHATVAESGCAPANQSEPLLRLRPSPSIFLQPHCARSHCSLTRRGWKKYPSFSLYLHSKRALRQSYESFVTPLYLRSSGSTRCQPYAFNATISFRTVRSVLPS